MMFWFLPTYCYFCFLINPVQNVIHHVDTIAPIPITPEMELHKALFGKTGRTAFPEFGKVVDVFFTIKLLAVVDIEIQNEAIVINANMQQEWHNPSIKWDPEEYGNIKSINVRPEKIWIPDIFVYANIEVDKKYNGLLSIFNTQVIVNATGHHNWLGTITMRMSCTMNTRDYPFDQQVCPLQFGSFTYDSSRLNLHPNKVNVKEYGESPEWYYISMNHTTLLNLRPGSPIPFKDAIYTIVMKRKPLYPLTMIVAPNLILAFLTILVYLVPIDAGERVMYIFTIFLAVTWYMTSNIDTMPNNGQTIPLITYFLGLSIVSLALLSICLCYTITCYYADSQIVKMPKWVRSYILEQFGRHLGIEVDRKSSPWRHKLHEVQKLDKYLLSTKEIFEEEVRANEDQVESGQNQNGLDASINSFNPNELTSHNSENDLTSPPNRGSLWHAENNNEDSKNLFDQKTIRCIHIQVERLLQNLEQTEDSKWRNTEWQLVASTLDKMFFYFFSSALSLTVFACVMHVVQTE